MTDLLLIQPNPTTNIGFNYFDTLVNEQLSFWSHFEQERLFLWVWTSAVALEILDPSSQRSSTASTKKMVLGVLAVLLWPRIQMR